MKLTNALANHQYDWIIWQKKKNRTQRNGYFKNRIANISHKKIYIYVYYNRKNYMEENNWQKYLSIEEKNARYIQE